MIEKNGFVLLNKIEFRTWLNKQSVPRTIRLIQNHHTYIPGYAHFDGSNHFARLQAMKNYHVNNNGWSDIAQNITTFPDGTIAICRPLTKTPAGIKGQNSYGICIEHTGNFDQGGDVMTPEHKESIIHLNAVLCEKFNLVPTVNSVVYHHWYDLVSGKRKDGQGTTKTCPGTNFFGGNKVEDAQKEFIPLIKKELVNVVGGNKNIAEVLKDMSMAISKEAKLIKGIVTANMLNIRDGAGASFTKVGKVELGTELVILAEKNRWYKIDDRNHWVSAKYVRKLVPRTVNASELNVRTGPNTTFPVIKKLKQGDLVRIFETTGNWSRIAHSEEWLSTKYLK